MDSQQHPGAEMNTPVAVTSVRTEPLADSARAEADSIIHDQATPSFFEIAEQQQSLFNPRPAQGATTNGKLKADV